jgi:hypothetical protein
MGAAGLAVRPPEAGANHRLGGMLRAILSTAQRLVKRYDSGILPGTIRALARVAGIEIPEEDLEPLTVALKQHLAAIELLPKMAMADVESPLVFQVTWDE